MASVVRYVFGCCIRAHSPGPKEPDERTPFIQPSDEVPPIRTYTVDHDRLKERLGTIVRSKEGKMVNVNQPLPFNLYGRPPHARLDRSLSANTTPPRASSSTAQADLAPQSSTTAGIPHLPRMPSQSTSREPSPSIQTSRSTSSLHPGDASYLPPEADPEGGSRKPILNVRLVRGPGGFFAGARPRPGPMTRGRPGRPSEERARENGDGSGAPGSTDGKGKAVADGANGTPDAPSSTTAEAHTHADNPDEAAAAALNGNGTHSHADGSAAAQAPESSGSDSEFKIEDVGDIAQSWGD